MIATVIQDIYTHCNAVKRRGTMQEYTTFIETCLEGFDKASTDPQELFNGVVRFSSIASCLRWDEHIDNDETLERAVLQFKRSASRGLLQESDRALSLLLFFADYLARSQEQRLKGNVAQANDLASWARAEYAKLPEQWCK